MHLLTVRNLVIIILLLVLLPAAFWWTGRMLARATPEKGEKGHHRLLALGLFARSFFPGILLLALAFLLNSSSLPIELREIGNKFFGRLGLFLLALLPVRSFCGKNGLAIRAFHVSEKVAAWFKNLFTRSSLLYLLILFVPRTLGALLPEWDSIPFLAKLVFHIGIIVFTWSALRREKALALHVKQSKGRRSLLWKNWNLIRGIIVLVLFGTLVGDLLGYRFAADSIFHAMIATALAGFILFILYKPTESGALQLSEAHAIAWDEAIREEGNVVTEEGAEASEVTVAKKFELDQASRDRTKALVRTVFLVVGVLTMIEIWNTDGRLYYAFDQISLLHVGETSFSLASLGWLVAALGVGLGFGLQEIVSNFVSGIIILMERPIRVGDVVTVGGNSGAVSRINIRATTITNWDRQELIIPNKDFITKEVINWTLTSGLTRVIINIGVAYGTDPKRVKKLLLEIATADHRVANDPAPMALFRNHGASSLDFELRVYVPELGDRIWVEDSLTTAINERLVAEGIEIPFPQTDLHIRSGQAAG